MRIAEKTVELNFCKGFPLILGRDLVWFGLTQKQEAKAGFDACARAGSALLLFQLKASRIVLSDGSRRFLAEHQQMQILRNQVRSNRHVFYVLPMIGTTAEICHGLCFSHCSRYLDVSRIPSVVPKPFAKGKSPPVVRRNGCHYMDMDASCSKVTIHSDPFTIDLVDANGMRELLGSFAQEKPQRQLQRTEQVDYQIRREPESIGNFENFWHELDGVDRTALVGAYAA